MIKKVLLLSLLMALTFSGVSLAAVTSTDSTDAVEGSEGLTIYGDASSATASTTMIGKLSTGVRAGWTTGEQGYAIITLHKSGSQTYGSAHDSTSIYRASGLVDDAPTASDSSSFDTGWTAL